MLKSRFRTFFKMKRIFLLILIEVTAVFSKTRNINEVKTLGDIVFARTLRPSRIFRIQPPPPAPILIEEIRRKPFYSGLYKRNRKTYQLINDINDITENEIIRPSVNFLSNGGPVIKHVPAKKPSAVQATDDATKHVFEESLNNAVLDDATKHLTNSAVNDSNKHSTEGIFNEAKRNSTDSVLNDVPNQTNDDVLNDDAKNSLNGATNQNFDDMLNGATKHTADNELNGATNHNTNEMLNGATKHTADDLLDGAPEQTTQLPNTTEDDYSKGFDNADEITSDDRENLKDSEDHADQESDTKKLEETSNNVDKVDQEENPQTVRPKESTVFNFKVPSKPFYTYFTPFNINSYFYLP